MEFKPIDLGLSFNVGNWASGGGNWAQKLGYRAQGWKLGLGERFGP